MIINVNHYRLISNTVKEIMRFFFTSSFVPHSESTLSFRPAANKEIKEVEELYSELCNSRFSVLNRVSLLFNSKKRLLVIEDNSPGDNTLIGINYYYINPRDFREGTIHEGFIGVLPDYSGRGLATKMRRTSHDHFEMLGFKGVSTRVSKGNVASLRSAEKLGFQPVEEYYDPYMRERRYYMVCYFGELCEQ